MALSKKANATKIQAGVSSEGWGKIRTASHNNESRKSLIDQASDILGKTFSPDDYQLTHCSIVASVDTEKVLGIELGSVFEDGKKITRKWDDFKITKNTMKWINNNDDAFERKVLLKSYKTFIGAENYLEHIQIPEQSKGKIIDTVARDIGESIYIDILVATDKKHVKLIQDIRDKKLTTLSMGCLLYNTPILMADGTYRPIQDIIPYDKVITHKGNIKNVLNRQTISKRVKIISFKNLNGEILLSCTENHPIFLSENQHVPASEVSIGDTLYAPTLLLASKNDFFEEIPLLEQFIVNNQNEYSRNESPEDRTVIEIVREELFATVYDIEVEDDHSFLANGIAVHNCTIEGSVCTKCGNWAVDEPEMCVHILYMKGNTYFDNDGEEQRIAELCGHHSIDPNGGVIFIEGSWVGVPAFEGAVMRNILEMQDLNPNMADEMLAKVASTPREKLSSNERIVLAAFNKIMRQVQSFDFDIPDDSGGSDSGGSDSGEDAPPAEEPKEEKKPEKSEIDALSDELTTEVLNRVKKNLKDKLKGNSKINPSPSSVSTNDNLVKEATLVSQRPSADDIYDFGLLSLVRVASSDVSLIDNVMLYDQTMGRTYNLNVYRAALKLGPHRKYKTASGAIDKLLVILGRKPTHREASKILSLSKLLSLRRQLS